MVPAVVPKSPAAKRFIDYKKLVRPSFTCPPPPPRSLALRCWYLVAEAGAGYPTLGTKGSPEGNTKGLCFQDPCNQIPQAGGACVTRSVMSNSLRPRGQQMPRLPVHRQLPELAQTHVHRVGDPAVCSSVAPFLSCLQSFPASGSFPVSQCFAPGGQRIGLSASASVLPMNIHDWLPWALGRLDSSRCSSWARWFWLPSSRAQP